MAQPPKRSNFEGPELGAQCKVTAGVSEVQVGGPRSASPKMAQPVSVGSLPAAHNSTTCQVGNLGEAS